MTMLRKLSVLAFVVALAVGACGGDDGDGDAVAGDNDGGAAATSEDGAAETTAAPGGGGTYPACPITAEQVASVTGEPMEADEGACQFHPASGKLNPNVLFVKQSSILDRADVREENGLVDEVEGIGDEAYASGEETTGTRIAVRDGAQWFEVEVDVLSDAATELAWAKEIAALIAENN